MKQDEIKIEKIWETVCKEAHTNALLRGDLGPPFNPLLDAKLKGGRNNRKGFRGGQKGDLGKGFRGGQKGYNLKL